MATRLRPGTVREPRPSRSAWWCLALAPLGWLVAMLLALVADAATGIDADIDGALLVIIALVAPVAAVVEAERAVHSTLHAEHERGHRVVVVAWVVLAVTLAILPLSVVSLDSLVIGAVAVGVGTALVVSLQRHDEEAPRRTA